MQKTKGIIKNPNNRGDNELEKVLLELGFFSGFGYMFTYIMSLDVIVTHSNVIVKSEMHNFILAIMSLILIWIYSCFSTWSDISVISKEDALLIGLFGIAINLIFTVF